VCFPNPSCRQQAQMIFDSFGLQARKVDDMFSVMLCDKALKRKVMEDFSCNNVRVEVQSWKEEGEVACKFETNWPRIVQQYCK
jgi:hypothetical protein